MKFETVLNAYGQAVFEVGCPQAHKKRRRLRQLGKFRAWLMAHAARPCRAKRLEWEQCANSIHAKTAVGNYVIYKDLMGTFTWTLEAWASIGTFKDGKAAAQAHFDGVWRKMTDCEDEPKRGTLVLHADPDAAVIAQPAAGEPGHAIIMFYSDGQQVQAVVDMGQIDDLANSAIQIFKHELREKMRTMLDNEPEALKKSKKT